MFQIEPEVRSHVETTGIRQKSGGNIGGFGGFLLVPMSRVTVSVKNTTEVGTTCQFLNPVWDVQKEEQELTGQRAPDAVDIDSSTRVGNISDNICVVLESMMDTFHQFDLTTVLGVCATSYWLFLVPLVTDSSLDCAGTEIKLKDTVSGFDIYWLKV